jgi:hypothetical protein
VLLLMVDPPGVGEWLMFTVMAAICLPIAAFMLMGRHVLVDPAAGRVVMTHSFGPLRWRRRRVLAEFRLVSSRFRPVSARAWLVRATPTAEVRETFQVILEGTVPLLVQRCVQWRSAEADQAIWPTVEGLRLRPPSSPAAASRRHRPAPASASRAGSSTERPCSHCSTSAVVINMTGIAFSWMGSTTPLGSVVIVESRMWAPMVGSSHGPSGRRAPAVMV